MLAHLFKILAHFNEVSGLQAHFLQDGSVRFNLTVIKKQKEMVNLVMKQEDLTYEALVPLLKKENPVSLCVTGKGVLVRKISGTSNDESELLKSIFPNAREDEFVVDRIEGINNTFLSVIRKEPVNELVEKFKKDGIYVTHIHPGPGACANLIPLLNDKNKIQTGIYSVEVVSGKVSDITLSSAPGEDILIGEELIPAQNLLSFAVGFQTLIGADREENDNVSLIREEWSDKTVFKKMSVGILTLIGAIVFINLGCFFYLSGQNQQLSASSSLIIDEVNFLESIEQEVKEKEAFLGQAGWLSFSRASFFSDRLAATVPEEVTLTELAIHPVDEQASKNEKKLVVKNGEIIIKGSCKNPVVLNPWIKKLKELEWVKDVASQNYSYDHKKRAGTFSIRLEVKDEVQ